MSSHSLQGRVEDEGRHLGGGLAPIRRLREMVEVSVEEEIADLRRTKELSLSALLPKIEPLELELAELREARGEARSVYRGLESHRNEAPSEYSVTKGLLYVALAILLILADISVLGRVAADFLGYDWRIDGRTFSQWVFFDYKGALARFPDLFWLTLAVLVSGFFLKVWRDSWSLWDRSKNAWRGMGKWDFVMFLLMTFLAVASFGLMASARLEVGLGEGSDGEELSAWARWVSFVLGLALPLVSTGFFIKGYDAISRRVLLFRLHWRFQWLEWRFRRLVRKRTELEGTLGEIRSTLQEAEDSAYRESVQRRVLARGVHGYLEGLRGLLDPGSAGVTRRIRPVLLARALLSNIERD